ncbi:hypothetical protein BIU82_15025 [Arthrobacter sp. SW1]|uniref:DUF998 domain-containing protein n=1 Tax=Arthrobacter sp. SW1 TaxID=1920889 RepID=UPI000877D174|nr:DUF998 domain-containing protein [Arthrobacter sp. SW1]OFI39179.1 hypothetical protein BIU82_15025 [Arthrobacter sp. SW1]
MRKQMPARAVPGSFLPDLGNPRALVGAWAELSVVQYFAAETAVIAAWAGPEPYDRRTGFISDLGAVSCGIYDGRNVCSPLHLLMNLSFVVQGLGLLLGAILLGSSLLSIAARPGAQPGEGLAFRRGWSGAVAARVFTGVAGAGTIIVGLVPEDFDSPWHFVGALMFFTGGAFALLLLGFLWIPHTRASWFLLACGGVTLVALIVGAVTRMDIPEPGTLERLMAYPVTIGFSAAGLVIGRRVRRVRKVLKAQARAARPNRAAG